MHCAGEGLPTGIAIVLFVYRKFRSEIFHVINFQVENFSDSPYFKYSMYQIFRVNFFSALRYLSLCIASCCARFSAKKPSMQLQLMSWLKPP